MPKGKKFGGRQKGTPNKATQVREHFTDAWNKLGGKAVGMRLVKAALERAQGYESVERTYEYEPNPDNPKKRVRVLVKEKVTREHSDGLLALLLPYVAQQLPRLSEVTGKDGAPLVPPAPMLPPFDLSKLPEGKLDQLIAALAAKSAATAAPAPAAPAATPPPAAP